MIFMDMLHSNTIVTYRKTEVTAETQARLQLFIPIVCCFRPVANFNSGFLKRNGKRFPALASGTEAEQISETCRE